MMIEPIIKLLAEVTLTKEFKIKITMKKRIAIQIFCLTNLLIVSISKGIAEPEPAVKVGVYAERTSGKVVYSYRVINNSQQAIAAISIGRNQPNEATPDHEVNELVERPLGWNAKSGIPSASYNSPAGWRVSLTAPQENQTHAITWESSNARKLPAGQSQGNMSITLNKADPHYLTGHALITFADGNPLSIAVPIERLDTTPPKLAVSLSPNTLVAMNNKFVAINASFTTKGDNYDHMPEIKLESITANEPLAADDIRDASYGLDDRYFKLRAEHQGQTERIYKVSYSATDASGNKAIADATVTVGLDQADTKSLKAN